MNILTGLTMVGGALVGATAKKFAANIVKNATPEATTKAMEIGYKVVGSLMVIGLAKSAVDAYGDIISIPVKIAEGIEKKIKNSKEKKENETKEAVVEEQPKTEG